jgi:hypothetical protein
MKENQKSQPATTTHDAQLKSKWPFVNTSTSDNALKLQISPSEKFLEVLNRLKLAGGEITNQ